MGLFKASTYLPTCSIFQAISPPAVSTNTSYRCLSTRDSRYHKQRHGGRARAYATVANDDESKAGDSWPQPSSGQSCPSPYQIFDLARDAPYTKARFYELVKVYHPDRDNCNAELESCSRHSQIPPTTRLERYRLIVAAHNILSDPIKRDAYDRYGAGWAGKADASRFSPRPQHRAGQAGPFTSWHERPENDIWSNATWEDWERWRRRHGYDGEKEAQSPMYFQNSTFLSIIMVLAAVGSSLNYNRAESEGGRFLAARDAVHDQTSKDLRKVRETINERPKDERIDWFLRNREAALTGYGLDELREEKARHVLPPSQACASEDLRSDE